jgi:ABC-type dipeptide/oligopeptide/nickel transport system permease subunit
MGDILEGLVQAFGLIFSFDPILYEIIWFSLYVSGVALFFSTLVGIPLGAFLGLKRFRGRRLLTALLYTGMGFPPVVIGLFVYLMLSRKGPMGDLGWLIHPQCHHSGADNHLVSAGGRFYYGRGDGGRPQLTAPVGIVGCYRLAGYAGHSGGSPGWGDCLNHCRLWLGDF